MAVGGRSPEALSELAGEGFGTVRTDVTDSASAASARDAALTRYPELDTVVTMPGVMLLEDLRDPAHFEAAQTTIDTNLVSTIRVIDAFTPHLVRRGEGTYITVTSGIAFLSSRHAHLCRLEGRAQLGRRRRRRTRPTGRRHSRSGEGEPARAAT